MKKKSSQIAKGIDLIKSGLAEIEKFNSTIAPALEAMESLEKLKKTIQPVIELVNPPAEDEPETSSPPSGNEQEAISPTEAKKRSKKIKDQFDSGPDPEAPPDPEAQSEINKMADARSIRNGQQPKED